MNSNNSKQDKQISHPIRVLSFPSMHPYMAKLNDEKNIIYVNPNSDFFFEGKFEKYFLDANFPISTYNIVHIHFSFDRVPINKFEKLLKYFKERKKPIVWTTHSLESLRKKNLGNGRYQQLLFTYADQLISPTKLAKESVIEIFGKHKKDIPVIPLGYMASPLDVERIGEKIKKDKNLYTILIGDFRENKEVIQSVINFLKYTALKNTKLQLIYKPINCYENSFGKLNEKMLWFYIISNNPRVVNISLPFIESDVLTEAFLKSHAVILPYLWGTHSGQVELAKDCGCHIVSSNVGFFSEQWPDIETWDISDGKFEEFPKRYTNALLRVYKKK